MRAIHVGLLALPFSALLFSQACFVNDETATPTTSSGGSAGAGTGGSTGGTGGMGTGGVSQDGLPTLDKPSDPLVPTHCGYPVPSNVYLKSDPTT